MLAILSGCKRQAPQQAADPHDHAEAAEHAHEDGHDHGAESAHTDEVRLAADAIAQYGLTVEPAQTWLLKPTFTAPASVGFNAEAMAHIGSRLRGRVVELKVRLGDAVSAGDPLVVIESPELGEAQAELLQRRSAAQTAQPSAELAKVAWERAKGLHEESEGISLTEVQRREAEYKAAVATVKAAEAAAIAAENRLHLLGMSQDAVTALSASSEINPLHTISAPIAGQVVEREVTLGELVGPDRESIMILADLSTLWVLADVPEARLGEVSPGARSWITIGAIGSDRIEGTVAFVSPLVDPSTRTAQVRVEVLRSSTALRPGMFAQVEIESAPRDGSHLTPVVAIPEESVQTVEGAPAVFVPVDGEANTFSTRRVTVGRAVGGLVPIHAGLVDGERFVRAGSFILKAELGKASAEHVH